MKQFVKVFPTNGDSFKQIAVALPDKIKAGAFSGPLIRQLIKDKNFTGSMTDLEKNAWLSFTGVLEKNAWLSFKGVVKNFLGNTR